MANWLKITVFGKAAPAGSKRAVTNRHTGQVMVIDANPRARPWKDTVSREAVEQYEGPLLDEPLRMEVDFYEPRPKSHYGTGRNAGVLKAGAPEYPTKKPDGLKLRRGVEDALTGIVYRDDSLIVDGRERKLYGEPARCEIRITPMAAGGAVLEATEDFEDAQLELAAA